MGLGKKTASPAEETRECHGGGRKDGGRYKDECCKSAGQRRAFACFKALYENKRSGLCLFEDEHGHLTAVDARRLV